MTRHVQSDERLFDDAAAAAAAAASAAHVTVKADKETLRRCRPTLAMLLVAVAALLPAASAAPAPAPAVPTEHVWIDPCGIHRDAPGNLNMKNVKKALGGLQKYLKDAINNVSKEWQRASGVYRELSEDQFPIDMEWLPRNQFNHYKDNVQGMKLPERLVHILQHVHDGVQKYLATVVWLQGDEASNLLLHKQLAKRTEFLSRMRGKLRSVQCSAQKAIVDSQARLLVQRPRIEDLVDAARFPQPSQSTLELLLRDSIFQKRLEIFLGDWHGALEDEFRALEEMPAAVGSATGATRRRRSSRGASTRGRHSRRRAAPAPGAVATGCDVDSSLLAALRIAPILSNSSLSFRAMLLDYSSYLLYARIHYLLLFIIYNLIRQIFQRIVNETR